MNSFPLKEIGTDAGLEDTGATMPKHEKADEQEEIEKKEEMVAQKGSEAGTKVKFQNGVEGQQGMSIEDDYEEAIRDATNATPHTPWPSPEMKRANPVSLIEDDYKELDIFWECVSPHFLLALPTYLTSPVPMSNTP